MRRIGCSYRDIGMPRKHVPVSAIVPCFTWLRFACLYYTTNGFICLSARCELPKSHLKGFIGIGYYRLVGINFHTGSL